jgi:PleD family two-component response regulator
VPTLRSSPGATDPAAPPLEPSRTPPVRVLVVDDHALVRIGLRQLLEQDGFSVVDADTELQRITSRRQVSAWMGST